MKVFVYVHYFLRNIFSIRERPCNIYYINHLVTFIALAQISVSHDILIYLALHNTDF